MKAFISSLCKASAFLLLLGTASCERADVTPERSAPEASKITSNFGGGVSLDSDPFYTGATLRIQWDAESFYSYIPALTYLETTATVEFWQNGVLKLTSRHLPVNFKELNTSNLAIGYIDYVAPKLIPSGTYTIVVKTENAGKSLQGEATPGVPITELQVNGTAITQQSDGEVQTAFATPGYISYNAAYSLGWYAADFGGQSNYSVPPMRAFLVNQSTEAVYQAFTQSQVSGNSQNPQGLVYGFDNNGSAVLNIGEQLSGGSWAVPNGTYQVFADNGSIASQYPFPISNGQYLIAFGPIVTITH